MQITPTEEEKICLRLPEKRKLSTTFQQSTKKNICSPTGNRTPGTTVRAWNVTNYTIEEMDDSMSDFYGLERSWT
jgi:hypothetical protein